MFAYFIVAATYLLVPWAPPLVRRAASVAHAALLIYYLAPDYKIGLGWVISFFMLGTMVLAWNGLQFPLTRRLLAGMTAAACIAPVLLPEKSDTTVFSTHGDLALLAYIAAAGSFFYWLDVLIRENQLRKHPQNAPAVPLLNSEKRCIQLVTVAFALLTLTLISGITVAVSQGKPPLELSHKHLFAVSTWLTFLALLVGHYFLGWRGRFAMKCFFVGLVFMLLSYIGSTFVLQIIIGAR